MIAGDTNENESSNEQNEHQTQGEYSSLAQRAARTVLVSCAKLNFILRILIFE